ncbi:MOSC domain-containing protein [Amycolatopsis thermoflava]|nr:MOSC domain-containing protein [Amycolatopsis thermoflava]ROS43624.1 hypothetical protein EDD35_6044 [Amycolatopsis thermoflava]
MLVGHLAAIFRYPVKSMAAQPLDEAAVSWHGLDGDRRWAFVRPGQESNGFPWLTIRRRNDLVRYQVVGESQVRTPDGRLHDVTDPALAAELGAARVQKLDRGTFDSAPLSLITTRSAGAEPLRFRPNLLIDTDVPEEDWIGRTLRIGTTRIRVDRRDRRCVVVNVDPRTGRRDPAVLRRIAREHDMCLGVYGSTVEPGTVGAGDEVVVLA